VSNVSGNEEIKQRYRQRQRQGKQDLRFLSLLLFLGLLFYTALNFYIVSRVIQGSENVLIQYMLYAFSTLLMWCIPLRMLWKFNKLGRWLYWLCLLVSLYVYKDVAALWDVNWEPAFYKYIFLVLFGLKCCLLCYGGLRLMLSSTIRGIWNVDDLFDEELAEMDTMEPVIVPHKTKSKAEAKAVMLLKRTAIRLGLCLYISMILIFAALGLLATKLPDEMEAVRTIQYQLFSESLFSVLIWSVPMIAMYMGKPWSPYLIPAAGAGEFLRLGLSYVQYIDLFQNKLMSIEIKLLFVMIFVLRYLLLYYSCRNALTHPLLQAYRSVNGKNNE